MSTSTIVLIIAGLVILMLVILVVYREKTGIWYYSTLTVAYVLNDGSFNTSGLSTPSSVQDMVKSFIKEIPQYDTYTFVDFGAGEGDVIESVHNMVQHSVGVELEPGQCNYARKRFLKLSDVSFECYDMQKYKFRNIPTILFLYEPLWDVTDSDFERNVYHNVFSNFSKLKSKSKTYIIYVTGVSKKALDEQFFNSYGFIVQQKQENPRGLFMSNSVYLLTNRS